MKIQTPLPTGSAPQAINIHQILWGQEIQAKLTEPERGTDLGECTFSAHMEKLEREWGPEGQQRWEMNVLPDLTRV